MNSFARLILFVLGVFMVISTRADPGPMSLWFTTPGKPGDIKSWDNEALPVGNGKLAAMVYGAVGNEQIQFNEETVWSGQPHYSENTKSTPAHLASIRAACAGVNGGNPLTEAMTYMMSLPSREASYQDAGSIVLSFPHSGTSNYRRTLDLNTATVNVHYDFGGVTYNRDIFASAPSNKVIVVHLTASQAGKVNFTASLATQQSPTFSTQGHDVVMHAKVIGPADSRYYTELTPGLTNAVYYDARLRVIANGGTVIVGSSSITVTNADDATLLLAVVSNFKNYHDLGNDYQNICSNNIVDAAALAYAGLRQAQLIDYQNLFSRVVLDLGGNSRTNQDIGFRKKQMSIDGADPQLIALDFQLGRYAMIAASRPGSQALNLQGKWNSLTNMGNNWDGKMTLNINEEMNYWGAEAANLSECTLPLFDMIHDLSETGHRAAGTNYFCDGWVAHHNTDLWRDASAVNGNDGIWPTGGAWLCQHLWWHYLYTGDTNWLATNGYPLMKSAAQFFQGFLITGLDGYKVTNPSYSPEHDGPSGGPNYSSPTMDNELLRDLFSHVIEASQILGVDNSFRSDIATLQSQLPPDKIGSIGQLQEWLDVDEGSSDGGHRHCSHLVGFFPGDEISTYYTPALAAAAGKSIELRGYGNSGLTPWSISWRLNLRTRLQDGEGAMSNLLFLYGYNKVSTNLLFGDGHEQMDCIFGRLSGIAEMFLQSPRGEVILLPALPASLTNGMVSGLCARGGFEVDNLTWTNGRLAGATILSKVGNTCRLRSKWPIDVKLGSNYVDAPMVLPGLYQFSTTAGSNYTILPATIAEVENLPATTSGATQQIVTNAALSNWRDAQFNAMAAGNSVAYVVSNLNTGNYHIVIGANAATNCGQFQLAGSSIGGSFTNIGSVQDTYSSSNMTYLLASHMGYSNYFTTNVVGMVTNVITNTVIVASSTNAIVLWPNMQKEFDCGIWSAPSNGNYNFKFTVAGKNAGGTGYALALDYIKFTPVAAPPLPPIEQWRAAKFGADASNPAISGDNADPDHDGAPNLLEYALCRNPLVADVTDLTTTDKGTGYFTLTYHRAKIATDVTFIVEVKDDLTGVWTTNVQPPVVTDDGNGLTDTVRVQDSVPMNGTPHRFMRLRVTRP